MDIQHTKTLADRLVADCEEAIGEIEKWKGLYFQLLMAVGNKYPNETRHETALRYIRTAETARVGTAMKSK